MHREIAWVRNTDVKKRTIVGKAILLNPKSNRLLILNEQASAIWDALDDAEPRREKDIVAVLQKEYAGAIAEQIGIGVRNVLRDFGRKGFVCHENDGGMIFETEVSDSEQPSLSGHFPFLEELHKRAARGNVPISGGLELTQRCHLKCIHCYIDNQPTGCGNELSTEEVCTLLEQMAECGCLWLLITGGEPLLRKDFVKVYRHAKEIGMIVTVFTSATNLTRQVADVFVEYPPFLVEATLHGATETTFDAISRVPGSFRQFKRGIQLLQDLKVPFHLKMIVMRQNFHEVEAARQLAIDLGARDFRFDPMVNANFLHSKRVKSLRITADEALQLDRLEPYQKLWKRVYRTALKKQGRKSSSRELLFPCRSGKCSFTVSADGQLLPCVLMRTPTYDLRKMSFSKAWSGLNRYTTAVQMRQDNPCRTCPTQTCSRCPAWGYLEHRDPDAKSRFACTLQREREKFFLNQAHERR